VLGDLTIVIFIGRIITAGHRSGNGWLPRLARCRELLETIRERVDYAISRLKSFEEVRSLA